MSGQKDDESRERDDERAADRQRFEEDLETRGESARADDEGKLPPGVTHEVKDDGTVKRRRFNAS